MSTDYANCGVIAVEGSMRAGVEPVHNARQILRRLYS